MLRLPDVTLVLVETREHALAGLALEDCERRAEFGDVLVLTDRVDSFARRGRRVIEVPDWPDKEGWSRCFWTGVAPHMRTSHALCIQWDSWIVEPDMWRDEYLKYDYIGAPWWYKDGMNVGNGGFCLRSTRLMRFVHKHRAAFPCVTSADDDLYCRKYRPTLQEAGFVWAPESVAFDFAFECVRPDTSARHFGFHATFNFGYGCGGDDHRLLERAEIMSRSTYIRNGKGWGSFAGKHPQIIERLNMENDNG